MLYYASHSHAHIHCSKSQAKYSTPSNYTSTNAVYKFIIHNNQYGWVSMSKKEARGARFTYVLHMYTCTCVFFSKQNKLMLI